MLHVKWRLIPSTLMLDLDILMLFVGAGMINMQYSDSWLVDVRGLYHLICVHLFGISGHLTWLSDTR